MEPSTSQFASTLKPESQLWLKDPVHFLVANPEIESKLVEDYEGSYLSSALKYADQTSQNVAVVHYLRTR